MYFLTYKKCINKNIETFMENGKFIANVFFIKLNHDRKVLHGKALLNYSVMFCFTPF